MGESDGSPTWTRLHGVVEAAIFECLLLTREREFFAWRARWRDPLARVYAGKVALLPSLARDLLAAF